MPSYHWWSDGDGDAVDIARAQRSARPWRRGHASLSALRLDGRLSKQNTRCWNALRPLPPMPPRNICWSHAAIAACLINTSYTAWAPPRARDAVVDDDQVQSRQVEVDDAYPDLGTLRRVAGGRGLAVATRLPGQEQRASESSCRSACWLVLSAHLLPALLFPLRDSKKSSVLTMFQFQLYGGSRRVGFVHVIS